MSERDLDVLALIDRAATDAPPMSVQPDSVLEGGRRKVRRRRAAGAGMGLATLALAGAFWMGPGQDLLGSSQSTAPAGQTTSQSEQDGTVRPATDATLTLADGSTVTLTQEGEDVVATGEDGQIYPTPLADIMSVSGLATLYGEGRPVYLFGGWELSDPALARVGSQGPAGAIDWSEPADVAILPLTGEDAGQVIALRVDAPPFGELVVGEEQPDGSVRQPALAVPSPAEGLEILVEPGTERPSAVLRGPTKLAEAPHQPEGQLWAWTDTDGSTLLLAEANPTGPVLPIVERDGRLVADPSAVRREAVVELAAGRVFLVAQVAEGARVVALAREDSEQRTEGIANYWHFVGTDPAGYVAIDDGLVLASPTGTWLLAQTTGRVLHDPLAGRADEDLLAFTVDERTVRYAALVRGDARVDAQIVAEPGVQIEPADDVELEGGLTLLHGTARFDEPIDDPAGTGLGLDLDGDERPDVSANLAP